MMNAETFLQHLASLAGEEATERLTAAIRRGLIVVTDDPTPLEPEHGMSFAKRLNDPTLRYFVLRHGYLTAHEWDRLWQVLRAIPVTPASLDPD
jgi:hypothetical protein